MIVQFILPGLSSINLVRDVLGGRGGLIASIHVENDVRPAAGSAPVRIEMDVVTILFVFMF